MDFCEVKPSPAEGDALSNSNHFSRQFEALEQDIQHGALTISQLLADKGVKEAITLNNDFDTSISAVLATEKALKYKVGNILAEGGMGVVLDAKDLNCRRKVAMKVINDDQQNSPDQVLRFIVEAQICAQLEHPGIVPVYELGVDATGSVFYTMKLVKGETLVDILIEIKNGNEAYIRKYPLIRLMNIYLRVCDAVAFAHSKNVVHRDLKPENIMIGDYGEVLIMDWGLAKILEKNSLSLSESQTISHNSSPSTEGGHVDSILTDGALGDSMKTMHGQIMGTPGFMPPEQALGKVEDIDTRSDIYALGGILFNILALQPPITGLTIKQIIRKIVRGDVRKPSSFNEDENFPHCPNNKIPEPLSAISMKALSSHPDDRYQKTETLQQDIEKYLGGFATSVEDAGFLKLLILLVKRNKTQVISTIVVLFLVISIISGFMLKLVEAKNSAEKNLHKFLHEHSARKDISRKLLTTAIEAIKLDNPNQKNLLYQYSLLDNDFSLNLAGNNQVSNINALQELPLIQLNLDNTGVNDLEVLQGMPLIWLSISGTNVRNLTPIKGLSLTYLDISKTKIADLSPISNLEIESLNLSGSEVNDFSGLRKLPLKVLTIESKDLRKIEDLDRLKLDHLCLTETVTADLKSLRNLSISSLEIKGRQFNNLNPIRTMNLKKLVLIDSNIKDIDLLKGMDLETLKIVNSLVDNIEVVQNLPLKELYLERCFYLKDLSPISKCTALEKLLIPAHTSNFDFLKNLHNLKVLATSVKDYEDNQSVKKFWENFDANLISK